MGKWITRKSIYEGKRREGTGSTYFKGIPRSVKNIILSKEMGSPLFEKYTDKIDNHAFRREYTKARYKEILGDRENKKDYQGYDNEISEVLTKDLGHNRLDMVVYHYLT